MPPHLGFQVAEDEVSQPGSQRPFSPICPPAAMDCDENSLNCRFPSIRLDPVLLNTSSDLYPFCMWAERKFIASVAPQKQRSLALSSSLPSSKPKRRKAKAVMRAIEFAEANLHRNVSRAEMVEAAEVSRFHLFRLFNAFLGQSPAKSSRARRVERRKNLLRETRLTLAEISLQCGFYHQSHFSKTFSESTGPTPMEFRAGN